MKTQRYVSYFIRIAGEHGSFCDFGWSGFSERLCARDRLKTAKERNTFQVYGPQQCAEHIAELRRFRYNGRKPYKRATFETVRRVTTERVITTADI